MTDYVEEESQREKRIEEETGHGPECHGWAVINNLMSL